MYSLSNKIDLIKINHTGTYVSAKVHCEEERKFSVRHVTIRIDHATIVMRIVSMIHHIADICMKSKLEWEKSDHGQKVCQCVHV